MRKKHVDTNNEGEAEPELPLPTQPKRPKMSHGSVSQNLSTKQSFATKTALTATTAAVSAPTPNPRIMKVEQKRSPDPVSMDQEASQSFAQPIRSYR